MQLISFEKISKQLQISKKAVDFPRVLPSLHLYNFSIFFSLHSAIKWYKAIHCYTTMLKNDLVICVVYFSLHKPPPPTIYGVLAICVTYSTVKFPCFIVYDSCTWSQRKSTGIVWLHVVPYSQLIKHMHLLL